jgi:low affinity Fe/Cu permease
MPENLEQNTTDRENEKSERCKPDRFTQFASWAARVTGGRWAFLVALAIIILWAVSGPFFGFSDVWQLVINSLTSIVTFLMVFLIQNTQNRDSRAIQLKLDELVHSMSHADNRLIDVENLTEEEMESLADRYKKLADHYHQRSDEKDDERESEKASV